MSRPTKREKEWLDNLSDGQLLCRDTAIHHSWLPSHAQREDYGFSRSLVCERCQAVKVQKLDRNGYVIGTRMVYPVGYLRPAGTGYASKEDNARIRKENMNRTTRSLRVV